MSDFNLMPQIERIMTTDIPEIKKLSRAFELIISQHIEITKREVEVFKAMGDQEGIIKEKIKANTMEYVLDMFRHLHLQATGRQVSDE